MSDGSSSQAVPVRPTPFWWRLALLGVAVGGGGVTYLGSLAGWIGPRAQAAIGVVCFISLVAAFSKNLRQVNWRTIAGGLALQVLLALLILRFTIPDSVAQSLGFATDRPVRPVYELFRAIGAVFEKFLSFSDKGAEFVFGALADRDKAMEKTFGPANAFVFAFRALATVIFISAFFTVLYHIRLLPLVVRGMAWVVRRLLGTSGAETLSAVANVFMGQTEAPLIIKPYVARMTDSELLAVMVGGMATIAGSVMAVYIGMGADAVAILATSVMAAPCGLYLSKLILPETEKAETAQSTQTAFESPYRNVVDAFSGGASEGVQLAINIAAMLIAFIALIALIDSVLVLVSKDLTLAAIFAEGFAPVAVLTGVESGDSTKVGQLLGTKLAVNEFVAYIDLTSKYSTRVDGVVVAQGISRRSYDLATFALTGFANFASIGIQIGGIGAMAPERRKDLARLGFRALFVGFLATLVNAAIAGLFM